ncbi:unnamed protein product [Prunus armeniaca]|uniref:Uncharacterized protein n=1 Tax=Prunus armeniaca TaxID=36596 RepID=A0A6J5TQP8_PRUAR|nr:unnamed protein product [Prunus armeniaca]
MPRRCAVCKSYEDRILSSQLVLIECGARSNGGWKAVALVLHDDHISYVIVEADWDHMMAAYGPFRMRPTFSLNAERDGAE